MKTKTRKAPPAKQEPLALLAPPAVSQSINDGIGDLVHAIAGPVIVFPNTGWESTIPKWIFSEIQLRRLMRSMQEHRNQVPFEDHQKALDIECLVYIYPASLAAPMDHTWVNIYLWLGRKCMMERLTGGKQMESEAFNGWGREKLDDDEQRELDGLKSWLWRKNLEQKKELRGRAGKRHDEVVMIAPPMDKEGQMMFSFAKEASKAP
jgi:hypothetical protein